MEVSELMLMSIVVDSKFISFTAWRIDVTGTIYSRATAIEVTDGWKFLVNENARACTLTANLQFIINHLIG